MTTTVLVTGATGTVGREVVRALSTMKDVHVKAFVRNKTKGRELPKANVELCEGDLAKKETIEKACTGVDRVFLLSNADPKQIELQGNVIEAAIKTKVKHIVKLGGFGTSADSPIGLARWHAQTEKQIQTSGIPYTFLRPHFFMQNFFMYAGTIKDKGEFYAPLKDAKISMVDVRDIASVAAAVLTQNIHEGKVYDITGPESLSFTEAAQKLSEALGKKVTYVAISTDDLKKSMKSMGMQDWFVDDIAKLYEFFCTGKAAFTAPTVKDVTHRSGYTFAQFAKEYAKNFR